MEVNKTKIFKTNSYILKIIAIITMIVDHLTVAFQPFISDNLYFAGRLIGRIAFPIFAYQIALGYKKTKNPWKYFLRLMILAVISEVPFDLLIFDTYFNLDYNNVLWTLSAGLLVLILTDELIKRISVTNNTLKFLTGLVISFIVGYLCQHLNTDYGIMGVVLIYLFYSATTVNKNEYIAIVILLLGLHPGHLLALPLIGLDDGSKGRSLPKAFTYAVYPGHFVIAVILKSLLSGIIQF